MSKRLVIGAAVALFLGLIGLSIYRQLERQRVAPQATIALPVAVVNPTRGEVRRVLSYSGTLEPKAMVTLTPKVAGRIESIAVREGDWVRSGQPVATMDNETVRLQMDQAAGAFRAAEAQYEKAKKGVRSQELESAEALVAQAEEDLATAEEGYRRLERLYKEGAVSRTRFEEGERQFRSAQTQLDNARRSVEMMQQGASNEELSMAESQMQAMQAQYELAKMQLRNAEVLSPIAGRVVKVHTDRGNVASQATPLVTIVQDDPILVKVPLPEKHYGEIRERLADIKALVTLNALPGKEFSGRLSAISPTVDPASRTFTVEIELANPAGLLHAGMYARVDLVVERVPDALLVPAVALTTRGGRKGVFTVTRGSAESAHFVEIQPGLTDGSVVQVLGGLEETDRVVSDGHTFLEEGQLVAPRVSP